jgi:hypothetical protein
MPLWCQDMAVALLMRFKHAGKAPLEQRVPVLLVVLTDARKFVCQTNLFRRCGLIVRALIVAV